METLKRGSSGPLVRDLQVNLNLVGPYMLEADGKFGPLTENAVKDFQQKYGLKVDGMAGPQTVQALLDATAAIAKMAPSGDNRKKWALGIALAFGVLAGVVAYDKA